MKTVSKTCLHCKQPFEAPLREVKRGNGKFCSRSCSAKYTGQQTASKLAPNTECAFCGKKFRKRPSRLANKSGLHFCCREHKDQAQRLENGLLALQPDHYGNGSYHSTYREIAFRNGLKVCAGCGFDKHPEVLQVHHKDRDRTNNDPSNLEILCPTCHEIEHFQAGDGRWSSQRT